MLRPVVEDDASAVHLGTAERRPARKRARDAFQPADAVSQTAPPALRLRAPLVGTAANGGDRPT